ncbi:Guanine nucleotide-binding protein alpha-2 subunit [Mortierella sp. AD032]|nr:Guanine nucleotide-binding protein alpha-2 subunit [Mortierella sp. AD032]
MGLCLSVEERDERNISQNIDKGLEEDNRRLKKECKILLLGSGESGKSTIVKQMKVIHQGGYSQEELATYRLTNKANADRILDYRVEADPYFTLSADIVNAIDSLYHDPITATCMERSSEFYIMDSAPYFFSQVRRLGAEDYTPSVQDVLRARSKTTGISETRFNMGQLSIHMFDVGGQRSERKKWIHCFEAVTSIIFCVALSEYDQVLLEESGQNRMAESLVLFESVINSRWFLRTSIILFMNKIDLFAAKLPKVPLEKFFSDYTGGPDISKAAKYILWRFTQTNRARLHIYPHMTQATDTLNLFPSILVFAAVKETILQNALKDSGIL